MTILLKILFTVHLLFFYCSLTSGQQTTIENDSILSLERFLHIIADNHPSVKQVNLLYRQAEAELLAAKGGFDPKIYGDYEQKYFNSATYFETGEYGIKVPTWYGLEIKGAYTTSAGTYLNPEEKLPKIGQVVVGFSLPLLQGLWIDERRANVLKAKQTINSYKSERDAQLNDFIFEAIQVYWKWTFAARQKQIFAAALQLAEQRFRAIRKSYELGDRMAMDTLESYIQVQDRTAQMNDATLDFQEANAKLANFLWGNNAAQRLPLAYSTKRLPILIEENAPLSKFTLSNDNRTFLLENIAQSHPILKNYTVKLAQLDIDRKLKLEKFKPKLNLNYNLLGNGAAFNNIFTDNYKFGIGFSTSTLFRSERGDLALAKIKIENIQFARDQKTLELQNKLRIAFAELDNTAKQEQLYNDMLRNYTRLLALENVRFELGESSLFIINSRETKVIEAQLKLTKGQIESRIAQTAVDWAAGKLTF